MNASPAPIKSVAVAARGKVLIRPNADGDSNDRDDSDEDDNEDCDHGPILTNNITEHDTEKNGINYNASTEPTKSANEDDSSSSDDELLVSHRSKLARKSTESTKSKKTVRNKKIKKKPKKKPNASLEVESAPLSTNNDDDDDAIAAVAVVDNNTGETDSDSDAVDAVIEAVVVEEATLPPKKKRKKPGPKPKKKPKDAKKSSKSKSKRGYKRNGSDKKKRISSNDSETDESCVAASIIPHDRLKVAEQAREILASCVQRIPFEISKSHIVRNFGRIKIESGTNALETLYSNSTALYPIGFSCDRYEFSPVHGRFLKLRCDIIHGVKEDKSTAKVEEMERTDDDKNLTKKKDQVKKEEENKASKGSGPIFRIMWGRGIDESDDDPPFPFDLYSASSPLGKEADAVALPLGKSSITIKPEQGMRVKVRFDNDVWYRGSILQVSEKKEKAGSNKKAATRGAAAKKEKKQRYNVELLYDDGVKEEVVFPDRDIVLVPPGELFSFNCVIKI